VTELSFNGVRLCLQNKSDIRYLSAASASEGFRREWWFQNAMSPMGASIAFFLGLETVFTLRFLRGGMARNVLKQ